MTVTEAPGAQQLIPGTSVPTPDPGVRRTMAVRKRNGDAEPVDVNKIVRAVDRWTRDLRDVDPLRIATRTISGLHDGATTEELDRLSIQTSAEIVSEEPQCSRLAARRCRCARTSSALTAQWRASSSCPRTCERCTGPPGSFRRRRSRPATRIQQATVTVDAPTDAEAIACSLESPEACEACQ